MCDGLIIHLPNGDEFCLPPLAYELPRWWRIPMPDPPPEGPDWLIDFSNLALIDRVISTVVDQRIRGQLGDSLAQAVSVYAESLPAGVGLSAGAFKGASRA